MLMGLGLRSVLLALELSWIRYGFTFHRRYPFGILVQ